MSVYNKKFIYFLGAALLLITWLSTAKPGRRVFNAAARNFLPLQDTIKKTKKPSRSRPNYKPKDRYGDPYSNGRSRSPLLLGNPSNISTKVETDSAHEEYTIQEQVGEVDYRPPSTMTFEEYKAYKNKQMMQNYWRAKATGPLGEREDKSKDGIKSLKIPIKGLEGPFGSNFVDIKPNGVITMDFGGRWQRVSNPTIPVRNQRSGGFEFDQQISMNVVGRIGEKLKLTANWDTKATFEFQNNIKLEYTGFEEDIIQKIEAGFVSMPVNSSLISGAQNLFGIKTKLQFGRLGVTSVLSSQRGKVEEVRMQGGAQTRDFEIRADQYDENRHFLLGQFFRNNYERGLSNLPIISSGVTITRVNVYITNRVNNTTTTKNIIAYLDLGEANPYRAELQNGNQTDPFAPSQDAANRLTDQTSLNIYDNNPGSRDPSQAETQLRGRAGSIFPNQCDSCFGQGTDYTIITSARQLLPTEFTINPQLGFISLNTPVTAQDLVAVSYEYTYTNPRTGKNDTYKVGELVGDKTSDSLKQLVVLKLLKPIGTRPRLPTWNLMMKNIYQLGATQITRDNFILRLIYKDDSTGVDTPFLQTGEKKSLLNLLGMDRLNPNNDPPADGNFDFIDGVTIDSKYGRIIFPSLEPFGTKLESILPNDNLRQRYVFRELYQRQLADVRQVTEKNKFYIKGRFQSSSTSDIMLPGINIAPGSVTIFAGSTQLREDQYQIDYGLGRVKIIDQGVLTSGQEIRIKYEKQDLFNFRRKTFIGTRFDYLVNKDINLGATVFHQKEAPQITRTNIGDEPSSNTIWGLDANIKKDSRLITKIIDKLPIIQTKETSSVTFGGEFAQLLPGHPKVIDKGEGGTSFVDDFEGAETPYNLTNQSNRGWRLGSMPRINNPQLNSAQRTTLDQQFTESNITNGYHRGKLAWYNIDPTFYGTRIPTKLKEDDLQNKFVKSILPTEIFPQYQFTIPQLPETTFDLAYFPAERGPYNLNPELTADGLLTDPRMSWGSITRDLRQDIDFDNANIQYLEFWMLNPFFDANRNSPSERLPFNLVDDDANVDPSKRNKVPDRVKSAGKLYFNLGEISEDLIKDNEHFFENGLPVPGQIGAQPAKTTEFGKVPTVQFTTNAFESASGGTTSQDIGMDGLNDEDEKSFSGYQSFLESVNSRVTNPQAREVILADPSADNFEYYLDDLRDDDNLTILSRYKNFNGLDKNSPETIGNNFPKANSNLPDNEDLNQDNTLNFTNNYYEYQVDIDPERFVVGQNYIIGRQDNGTDQYLQFRIPIRQPTDTIGSIEGYKSLRFIRMYMTGFEEPVILRMAKLQLVANQWRLYGNTEKAQDLRTTGINPAEQGGTVSVSTVNIEENAGEGTNNATSRYVVPPGFSRDLDIVSLNNRLQNEQSLRLCVEDLKGNFSGSAFKNVNYNMLNYKRLRMFIHAESAEEAAYLRDDDLVAFLRVGTDYTQNYYEIEVPLKFTRPIYSQVATEVWRAENEVNISLPQMAELKARRNGSGGRFNETFSGVVDGKKINILGNPDLSSVQILMIGIRNPSGSSRSEHSACIWADELRLTEFVEDAGWATTARMNLKLADLANVTATGRYTSVGFGSIDQKVSQRALVNTGEWGVQGNMGLERFLPQKLGLRLPLYAGYNSRIISPKYNPLDPDVLLSTSIGNLNDSLKNDYKKLVLDQQSIKSINLTNIQKVKTNPDSRNHFYDVENLTLSIGYNETKRSNVNLKEYNSKIYNTGIGYTFNNQSKPFEPFKNSKGLNSNYLKLIKDLNFSFLPTSITFRGDLNRRLTKTQYWEGNPLDGVAQDAFYEKAFTFVRNYGLVWNLTRSITMNYTAVSNAIIDEPDGEPTNNPEYTKVLWSNVKKLGRSKNFTQAIGATYKVPFDKLPLTDWLNADVSYNGSYNWTAGANSQREEFGNLLSQNTRDMGVNGRIALDRLYSKSKFLKDVNNPVPKPKVPPPVADSLKKESPPPELKGLKAALRILMSVKFVNFSYKVAEGTKIGGYKGTANILGLERGRPGDYYNHMLPFVLGWQDPNIRFKLWEDSLVSKSLLLNDQFAYNKAENFTASTQLEPLKDFTIKLNVAKNKITDYRELFHISYEDPSRQQYSQDAPLSTGSYNISIIAIKSTFLGKEGNDRSSSVAYQRFVNSRVSFRTRRVNSNPLTQEPGRDTLYGLNSQDVLIPAFLAAYLGTDPNKSSLKSFPTIPLPNWNVSFTGLNKIKALSKTFQSINITHAYVSNFSVSSYSSSLLYNNDLTKVNPQNDPNSNLFPDSIKNNRIVPVYTIDVVSIKESFSPFIGINIRTKGRASYNIQYLKDRSLILSMANSQVQETQSNGITVGFAWNKTNFKIPFKWQGRAIPPLKNEMQFKADLTVRDNKTIQRVIGGASTVTAGLLTIQFRPTINYMISQRLNVTFYFDRQLSVPYILSSFRRGVTAFGIQLRFTLS